MADINIEKKDKNNTPIWPWILGALVLIGVIWAIAEMGGDDNQDREQVAVAEEQYRDDNIVREPQSNPIATAGTAGFVSYINDSENKDRLGEDNQVTGEALMRLSAALEGLSQNNNAYSQQIEEIRQSAQQLQNGQNTEQNASHVKNAFASAGSVLAQIQHNQYPETAESEVEDVQENAREIEANTQLSEQDDKVESFFEKAADAIEKMEEKASETMQNQQQPQGQQQY